MAIKRITVAGVRGIRHPLTLELGGKSLLLHGDNGTGKSSVERALRWALLGLEEPAPNADWDSEEGSRRHKLVKSTDPRVDVEFVDGGVITVRPGKFDANENGRTHRASVQRGMPFLRRAELLDVLTSKPVERFQYFESFLGLDRVDRVLKELIDEKAALERRHTDLRTRIKNHVEAVKPLLPFDRQAATTSAATLETEAVRVAAATLNLDLRDWDQARNAVSEAAQVMKGGDVEELRQRIVIPIRELDALRERLAGQPQWSPDDEARFRDTERTASEAAQLDLIEHAMTHFESHEGASCPICGQSIDWASTRATLRARRQQLTAYASLVRTRNNLADAWTTFIDSVDDARRRAYESHGAATPDPSPDLNAIVAARMQGAVPRRDLVRSIGTAVLRQAAETALAAAKNEAELALARLPEAGRIPALRMADALFTRLAPLRPQLFLLEAEATDLERELTLLSTIIEALRRARQDVAKEILGKIGSTVASYYFRLHPRGEPDEATGAPSIEVQRHGRGTAFVRGEFKDEPIKDPRWVYSDGHLDTVGICVFLALRRLRASEAGDSRLLVLDDIVLSIDLGHARRLIELLKSEFGDHQILLFTHNGLFAYWCTHLVGDMRRLRIKGWTLEQGPLIGDYRGAIGRLKDVIAEGAPKEIAIHIMQLMDEWTADARYAYAVAVPARFDEQYTLTDIWEPLAKKLRQLAKELSSDVGGTVPRLQKLKDLPAMRNALAAHENQFAKEFPRQVVAEMAADVIVLAETLRCDDCGTFSTPLMGKSGVMSCKCGTRVFLRKGVKPVEDSAST